MRIGIDIDGCLTDDNRYRLDHMTKYCFEKGYPNIDLPYDYERKCSFFTREENGNYRNEYFFDYIQNTPPFTYASEILHKLREEGHEIVIITGRFGGSKDDEYGQKVRDLTTEWLHKNNLPYDDLCFAQMPKMESIRKMKVELMIEDYDKTLIDCSKEMMTFCYDNPYNRDLKFSNVIRVYSWYDIYRKIHELFD